MTNETWLGRWDEIIAGGDAAAIEEFWLQQLSEGVADGTVFAEALRHLRGAARKTLVPTLLELAADEAESEGAHTARRLFLGEMLRLGVGSAEAHRRALEEVVRRIWAGRPSLERILAHFRLSVAKKPLDTLDEIENWLEHDIGGVFLMSGKGPGRVVEVNPQIGVLRIDLEREKKVPVPIGAAAKHLTPLPEGHFLRRRLEEREVLAAEVKADPHRGIELVMRAVEGPLQVTEIRGLLMGLVSDSEWTSWWNKARKHPHLIAAGSGTRVQYRLASARSLEDEIQGEFDRADSSARVDLARRLGGRSRALDVVMAGALIQSVNDENLPADRAWEATDLAERLGFAGDRLDAARRTLLARRGVRALLEAAGDVAQREGVLAFARSIEVADTFADLALDWLNHESHPRVIGKLVEALIAAGRSDRLSALLDNAFLSPRRWAGLFVWALEIGPDHPAASLVADRLGGPLLVRLIELAERREFVPLRARLKEILSARGLAGRLVQDRVTSDHARRMIQMLETPGELTTERAWLRRALMARFPEVLQAPVADFIPALATTVERMQAEIRHLKQKDIPEVLKAIQVAKEHGDLRENFEYHSARARQELLSARAAKLMEDLSRVRIIDPATVDTSVVRVGVTVTLRRGGDAETSRVTILGPYEGEPDRNILSAGSEAAQALLDHKPGDAVVFRALDWTVSAIEPAALPDTLD